MCGIAGRFNFRTGKPVDADVLDRMCDALEHRGPDDRGCFVEGAVGLANRRLAIVDLSPAGHMPMSTKDGEVWITHNGEVYNFESLREEFEHQGHRFGSRTDTEVIAHAYRELGPAALARLRGMFAFALWDARRQTLFVARDRLGKKPLYYYLDQDGIAFASEPKAFLADPRFQATPDLAAISHYLTFQYVPHPYSAFAGVRKLPPAHYLQVAQGELKIERYWRLRYRDKVTLSEDEAAEEILRRLKEAVRLRLISDVPLGAFLSGGIDSSTVVALMAELASGSVKTFSIGFEDKKYDELEYARLVAQRYATDHHEFVVRPRADEILDELVWHYNEPYADSSAIPTFYLARLTRQHVTVALNGDAGDENFAGYDRYLANVLAERFIPTSVQPWLASAARFLPDGDWKSQLPRAKRLLAALGEPRPTRYGRWISHFTSEMKIDVCSREFLDATSDLNSVTLIEDAYRQSDAEDIVDATLDVDVNTYLPGDLLVKVDIATMAHSLEGRSPFLDHEFMEFCASLPSRFKLRGRRSKYLLKRAVRPLLPERVIDRSKMGFGVPIDGWLRGELREMAEDILLSHRARNRGYFRPEAVARLLSEHVSGVRSWQYQLWNMLMLELWHRMFIDDGRRTHPSNVAPAAVAANY